MLKIQGNRRFPVSRVTHKLSDIESLSSEIEKGPYGRCVYDCDNNVMDNQVLLKVDPSCPLGKKSHYLVKIYYVPSIARCSKEMQLHNSFLSLLPHKKGKKNFIELNV